MSDILVSFIIVGFIVWALTRAFTTIDKDGAIWDAIRKRIATKLLGWFQPPVAGPSHGREQEHLAATKTVIDLSACDEEILEEENRVWEQVKEQDKERVRGGMER